MSHSLSFALRIVLSMNYCHLHIIMFGRGRHVQSKRAWSCDIRLSNRQCHLIGLAKLPYRWDGLFCQFSCPKVDFGLVEKNNLVFVKISLILTHF